MISWTGISLAKKLIFGTLILILHKSRRVIKCRFVGSIKSISSKTDLTCILIIPFLLQKRDYFYGMLYRWFTVKQISKAAHNCSFKPLKIKKRKFKRVPMERMLKIPGFGSLKEKRSSTTEMLAMITLGKISTVFRRTWVSIWSSSHYAVKLDHTRNRAYFNCIIYEQQAGKPNHMQM
jgi:hypothetical protein